MLLILIFNTVVVVAQMLAAWLSRSLSVLSDAIHMAIDSVSYAANFYIEHRRATEGPTERLLKAELWVSVFSLVALVCSTAWVAYEAAQKLGAHLPLPCPPVAPPPPPCIRHPYCDRTACQACRGWPSTPTLTTTR